MVRGSDSARAPGRLKAADNLSEFGFCGGCWTKGAGAGTHGKYSVPSLRSLSTGDGPPCQAFGLASRRIAGSPARFQCSPMAGDSKRGTGGGCWPTGVKPVPSPSRSFKNSTVIHPPANSSSRPHEPPPGARQRRPPHAEKSADKAPGVDLKKILASLDFRNRGYRVQFRGGCRDEIRRRIIPPPPAHPQNCRGKARAVQRAPAGLRSPRTG